MLITFLLINGGIAVQNDIYDTLDYICDVYLFIIFLRISYP